MTVANELHHREVLVQHLAAHTPFFDYWPKIQRIIYETTAIELMNMSLCAITKSRGSFPSDNALRKFAFLNELCPTHQLYRISYARRI